MNAQSGLLEGALVVVLAVVVGAFASGLVTLPAANPTPVPAPAPAPAPAPKKPCPSPGPCPRVQPSPAPYDPPVRTPAVIPNRHPWLPWNWPVWPWNWRRPIVPRRC